MWEPGVPLTVLVAGPVLVTFMFGMVRFQSRLLRSAARTTGSGVRVAVVSAGTSRSMALREMQQTPSLGLTPVVAIDDDPNLRWRSIHGVPIAGGMNDLADIVASTR